MLSLDEDSLFLAIDAGTTNIKAAIVTKGGAFIDMERVDVITLMTSPGACEMDMNAVWQLVCEAVTALYNRNKIEWSNICGVGVCAQGDGLWPVDCEGNPIRNAILWNDTRKASLNGIDIEYINKICLQYNTTPLFSGASPILLRFLKNQEPDSYKRIFKALHCKDWINFKLTGRFVTDVTDASTSVLNIFTKEYEYKVLDLLGISESADMFAEVVGSHEIIGGINEKAAGLFNIKKGTPVIAGAIDVLSVATGCGIMSPGQKGSIIGTTLCNYVVVDEEDAKQNLNTVGSVLCHTKDGAYIRLMAALSGASSLDWVRRELLGGKSIEETEDEMKKIATGSGGVLYHPYLYGERAPFALPAAAGGFYGLRNYHTKYNMVRAAYEGVALSMYDCYQSLPKADGWLCIAGGATKSNFICQMVCDCMGETTSRYPQKELGILGICRLIGISLGLSQEDVKNDKDVFEPDLTEHLKYEEIYFDFKEIREHMVRYWEGFRKRN